MLGVGRGMGAIDIAALVDLTRLRFTFPTSFFPGSLGASAIIAGTAVEYVGSMAPVPEITVDW